MASTWQPPYNFVEIGDQYINLDNVTRTSLHYRDGENCMDIRFVGGTSTEIRNHHIDQMEDALGDITFLRNIQSFP